MVILSRHRLPKACKDKGALEDKGRENPGRQVKRTGRVGTPGRERGGRKPEKQTL